MMKLMYEMSINLKMKLKRGGAYIESMSMILQIKIF